MFFWKWREACGESLSNKHPLYRVEVVGSVLKLHKHYYYPGRLMKWVPSPENLAGMLVALVRLVPAAKGAGARRGYGSIRPGLCPRPKPALDALPLHVGTPAGGGEGQTMRVADGPKLRLKTCSTTRTYQLQLASVAPSHFCQYYMGW